MIETCLQDTLLPRGIKCLQLLVSPAQLWENLQCWKIKRSLLVSCEEIPSPVRLPISNCVVEGPCKCTEHRSSHISGRYGFSGEFSTLLIW